MYRYTMVQQAVRWIVRIIVLIALAWFLVYSFFSQAEISGHSMEPGLTSDDVVLVDTLKYRFFSPSRMDVVVFLRPDGKENVKRIAGLPGETVVIQNGHIYIDGTLLSDSRISEISLAGIAGNPVVLGDQEYFLIGDNADSSEDSRFANIGNVRKSQIIGKAWLKLLPLKHFGLIR